MRTTISIDERLLEELKQRATEQGTTVSQLIEDSVRLAARRRTGAKARPVFKLVTYGKGGHFTRFDVDKLSSLIDEEDAARHARRR